MDKSSNVLAIRLETAGQQASAAEEVRRQLHQTYTLVNAARASMRDANIDCGGVADELLDMAEELLSDLTYINRLAPKAATDAAEVANG